jgi:5,10-methylenetetrahydrofolate reductase
VTGLLEALHGESSLFAAELRPPRAELDSTAGMDAWIDTYHAVRGLTRQNIGVFLTDSAVGTQEENNLRHLVTNLGREIVHSRVIPFLTSKHSLDFCLSYAEQAWQHGFSSLVILGGDKSVGRARSVEHAWQLRQRIRERVPQLILGGWANPYGDPEQQGAFLEDPSFTAEYYLTQIVSHLNPDPVERFLAELDRRQIAHPGIFGVFYYRSANRRTLETLRRFLPVPVDALVAEFESGAAPAEICARTIAGMRALGVRHFYISNLPLHGTAATLNEILDRVGAAAT